MISKNQLNYDECMKYARALPGVEHTQLRSLQDLQNTEDCAVYAYGEKTSNTGMLLSVKRDENGALKCYFSTGKYAHVIDIGSSGSGKGQGAGMNLLMNLDGSASYVCVDPKGELYNATHQYLRKVYGENRVNTINYMQPEYTDFHINQLCVLAREWLNAYNSGLSGTEKDAKWKEIDNEVRKYIDILFVVGNAKDPTWQKIAKSFIHALVIALFEDLTLTSKEEQRTRRKRTTPEMINFATVYKIFHSFTWGGGYRRQFDDKGFLTDRPHTSLSYQYSSPIINNAENTRANYMGFVEDYLKELRDPRIEAISAYNDFEFETIGNVPQIIFVIYDIGDENQREFVNKNFAQKIDTLLAQTHKQVKPLDVPVIFFIDEFSTLKPNPIYPKVLATGRGSNIFLHIVIQSYSQLEARYPEDFKAMIENCDYTFFIGTNDEATAAKFSSELGKTTIADPVACLQGGFSALSVPVVSQDYLMHRMKEGEVFIKINKKHPVHGFFEFYYRTEEYAKYSKKKIQAKPNKTAINCEYDAKWMYADKDEDLY